MATKLLDLLRSRPKFASLAGAWFAVVLGVGAVPQAHAQNHPPTTVSASAAGQVVGQPLTLFGRATDVDGNLGQMNFYITGPNIPPWAYVGTVGLSGSDYTASISYTPPTAGSYTVHIRAWDTAGVLDSNANVGHAFNVVNNTAPTTVSVTSTQGYIGQPVTFTGRATDPDGNLKQMDFYVNGPTLPGWNYIGSSPLSGPDATASISRTFNTPGAYAVHIRALDGMNAADSNANVLAGFSVIVGDAPPTTASISASGQFVGQPITFSGRATDASGNLSYMDFYVNGPNLPGWNYIGRAGLSGSDATASMSYTFDAPGNYVVHIRAYDAAGNTDSDGRLKGFVVKARSQILVDVNQLNACEAGFASTFAADGVWALPYNTPPNTPDVPWSPTLSALNASQFTITEDDLTGPPERRTASVDSTAAAMNRMPDAVLFYHEITDFGFGAMPTLSYDEISTMAAHVVPGFGPVGNRVVVLARLYAPGNPVRGWVDAALQNPNLLGVAFESQPFPAGTTTPPAPPNDWASLDIAGGVRACLAANKKCFMLLPPPQTTSGPSYLALFQDTMKFFEQHKLLGTPNLYFVPAVYGREVSGVGFASQQCGNTDRTMGEVVSWLRAYLNGTTQ